MYCTSTELRVALDEPADARTTPARPITNSEGNGRERSGGEGV